MTRTGLLSATALAVASGWALPAWGQPADSAAVQRELAEMRAQMQRMADRIDTLESQLAEAKAKADAATAAASRASESAAAATAASKPPVAVAWKGAPELSDDKGWSFKPRGRMQFDVGSINAPRGLSGGANSRLGTSTELRRAYIGMDGTMPGGFGYRIEADFANSSVAITDMYLTYRASPKVTLTVGQHKPFWGLEEMTSDLFTSNMERAAFASAFGFERRLGVSAQYSGKLFVVQGGLFSDDASSLNNDADKNWSVDGRIVAMPRVAGGTLHLGLSGHWRQLRGALTNVRYSARPFVHTSDLRFVDTGNLAARGERGIGAELAWISGPFHATAESHWLTTRRAGRADPTFNGGYAELGYLLTGEETAYKGGVYDRIRPRHPVGKGGLGALQVNARYDWLDLSDGGVLGGRQQVAGLSLTWIPIDYVRFIANYGHIWVNDAVVPAGGDSDYTADAFGMRAQVDF